MLANGSKRIYAKCLTSRKKPGAKIHVKVYVKNHKRYQSYQYVKRIIDEYFS